MTAGHGHRDGLSWVRFADCPRVPWANRLGETVEIFRSPVGGSTSKTESPNGALSTGPPVVSDSDASEPAHQAWAWRLSIATVDSAAPFSTLPGVDRALMALSEPGLVLDIGGRRTPIARHRTVHFAGEETVSACEVTASTLDLNLMVRRGLGTPDLVAATVRGSRTISSESGTALLAVTVLDGTLSYDGTPLARYDTLVPVPDPALRSADEPAARTISLTGDGTVALALF